MCDAEKAPIDKCEDCIDKNEAGFEKLIENTESEESIS